MSASLLREAAALMRERAEAARDSAPKTWDETGWAERDADWYEPHAMSSRKVASAHDSEHIASWHPAVALAVADWLDSEAAAHEGEFWMDVASACCRMESAIAIARAYLGTDA